jgi:hypothetical protein
LSKAQTDSAAEKKQRVFIASVTTMDDKSLKASLSAVNDTQLILRTNHHQLTVPAENVKSFTMKRKNSVSKGCIDRIWYWRGSRCYYRSRQWR